jgi:putative transposase
MSWQPSTFTRAQMTERRRAGGHLLQRGTLSQAAIARRLGVSEAAVSTWAKQIQGRGLQGLRARQASGRPAALSPVQHDALRAVLQRGAVAFGFETERWTLGRIRTVIGRTQGVWYSVVHIRRLLHRWGWSLQQPAGQARERDEARIAAWRHRDWPRIKKKPVV